MNTRTPYVDASYCFKLAFLAQPLKKERHVQSLTIRQSEETFERTSYNLLITWSSGDCMDWWTRSTHAAVAERWA